ncbi:MAG: type I methionyl aminopeptidase [Helicobacter sp.]|uniref:type I methionyl aminopeptidase n=1 Tax=Helicobacter sp. 10-6591 TaxID=2004998 RepID=UPI000DCF629C|nr:type I methionyl aminopeptidase [Helicobacter sp. 10-6591]MCI6217528.1 type I methionyl aminopeptidase [Helicobacter sp.]MCI7485346.1 type I methionyl aminopeptidase [Helicobacter sp.]MDD7567500.1 type I methionyl aminopeptidase [Helicobacter sp.]MDY5741024.1 type I methionyl aminopeptidase [Helicobacter sp.]RAX54331.1 type I methionyl aminopeptidase [Helicobacter sp. 10-6591]
MSVGIKSSKDIQALKIPNAIVARALELAKKEAKVGLSLLELDSLIENFILSQGGRPSFKGLYGFPNTTCISVNEVIIHGVPTHYRLKCGDIIGIDVGVEVSGWFGDAAVTFGVGEIHSSDKKLMECSQNALQVAIDSIRCNMHFKELSKILGDYIVGCGFVPLKGFCGHGIGRSPHEEPEIPNYLETPNFKQGPKIREGMVFCIEPMICQKNGEPKILEDRWSVVSVDGLNGSHHEHTVAIVNGKAEILTEV